MLQSPFEAGKFFEEANRLIEEKDLEEARLLLNKIKQEDEGREYAALAQLRLADTYLAEDELETAVDEYERFIREYPRHKHAAYAQYQIGSIYYGMIQGPDRGFSVVKKALKAFETLMVEYPRNPYREKAALNIEHCRELLGDHEYMVGEFYFKRGAYKGALGRFLGLLDQYPHYREEAAVLYRVAAGYRRLGDEENAGRYLAMLVEKYPDRPSTLKAKEEFSKPLEKD